MHNEYGFFKLKEDLNTSTGQWIIAISVALLIALYANSISSIDVIGPNSLTAIYQFSNISLLSLTLLILLFYYYSFFTSFEHLNKFSLNYIKNIKNINYTNTLSNLSKIKRSLIFHLLFRSIFYFGFLLFWFTVKHSYNYEALYVNNTRLLSVPVLWWAVLAVLSFIIIIDSPLFITYKFYQNIIRTQKTKNNVDLHYI